MGLNDRRFVESQYASSERLETRRSVWQPDPSGRTPQDVAIEALRARRPARVLEVGCGTGQLAERMVRELDAELVAVDLSPSMVEETRSRVVDARVADVEQLPFADGEFDCAVAAWVLYHLPDLDRGLAELARVLRPGGRLVAITNGEEALADLWALVGAERTRTTFMGENGEAALRRHFDDVARTDLRPHAVFPDRDAAARYIETLDRGELAARLPEFDGPLVLSGAAIVFVADRAAA